MGVPTNTLLLAKGVRAVVMDKEVPLDPKLCILNINPHDFVTSKNVRFLLNACFVDAKRCVAHTWKEPSTCGLSQRLKGMTFYLALERIRVFLKTN